MTLLTNYNVYPSYYLSHGTNKDNLYPKTKETKMLCPF